jgi:hypothetical protein
LPASQYYGIEGGSRPMSIAVFLSVSEALSIHPKELFNRALKPHAVSQLHTFARLTHPVPASIFQLRPLIGFATDDNARHEE